MTRHVPFNDLKILTGKEKAALSEAWMCVVDSGRFVLSTEVRRFERAFAEFCNVEFCVGVGNGSDGLVLALQAAGVEPGDSVGTVANAGFYSTAAILACGAQPLFMDIDADGFLPLEDSIEHIIRHGARAVVVTHLYGRMLPVHRWAESCRQAGVFLIEDCSQAHGARSGGSPAGSVGDLGVFSFYPTKNLGALGDGGAIVGRDPELESRLRRLRQYGWDEKYHVTEPGGRNSRLDELQAALLSIRLPLLEARNRRRRQIAAHYLERIDNSHIQCLPRGGEDDVVHLFAVRSTRRDELRAHLAAYGIGTDIHYPVPDHCQPVLSGRCRPGTLPHTEALATSVLSLPCHPGLSDENVDHVISACLQFRP